MREMRLVAVDSVYGNKSPRDIYNSDAVLRTPTGLPVLVKVPLDVR